jgi:hypothetical protein
MSTVVFCALAAAIALLIASVLSVDEVLAP